MWPVRTVEISLIDVVNCIPHNFIAQGSVSCMPCMCMSQGDGYQNNRWIAVFLHDSQGLEPWLRWYQSISSSAYNGKPYHTEPYWTILNHTRTSDGKIWCHIEGKILFVWNKENQNITCLLQEFISGYNQGKHGHNSMGFFFFKWTRLHGLI